MQLDIEPITPALGAFIHIQASDATKAGVPNAILDALNRYNVLVFPQVDMDDDIFAKLTAAMGDQHDLSVTADSSSASDKGIYRIALDKPSAAKRWVFQLTKRFEMLAE